MANLQFDKEITALLVIDPHNDLISDYASAIVTTNEVAGAISSL